ncbi:UDP-N-acetylmuramoyl-L-alanyl-D-glutamate--2,6-diaminopimelate ligase [Salsuginibacillus kocurii]|uniref:UDP-N-acetylmuramoyl-L-alanyl-D-glutamate--2, 6-diaminopimelate ligase n=1 Tax=Salsuginibacillus kocurii TaxID=427078 RepID=UPI0003759F4A|nr:UDP-N-acetylmuramoyl-L-alanyl-D-glutamate--2,6-diaminopimelate ligase [Salsuginibacillus kocurii]
MDGSTTYTLSKLCEILIDYEQIGTGDPEILSLEMDSREAQPQSLFICISGYTVDGHDFAEEAVKNGAVAIVAERPVSTNKVPVILVRDSKRAMAELAVAFYNQPTQQFTLYGVTGTNGKTTVTHLIDAIMQTAGKKTGMVGTLYTKIGDEVQQTVNTTPESLVLQRTFAAMADKGVEAAAMEVSSHALDLGRVRGCDFDVAVFTNLSPDHLDYHKTMEAYTYAKGLLFAQLGNSLDANGKKAVINADDPAAEVIEKMSAAPTLTYGVDANADVTAKNIHLSSSHTAFTLSSPYGSIDLNVKLIGTFSVYNVLAAASACLVNGCSLEVIKESLEAVKGVDGRFELVEGKQDFSIIVDYAHTADSLENVLKTLKETSKGRLITVVGCGGDRDRAKRPEMAKLAVEYADEAILTSDNPRSEEPEAIIRDMETGIKGSNYKVEIDRRKAIEQAVASAAANDAVLIAGKGHETYQEIKGERFYFDDREIAKESVHKLMKGGGPRD